MATKTIDVPQKLNVHIKAALLALTNTDGLKRTQRWLSAQTGIGEVDLSTKMVKNTFTQDDLDKINIVLSTDFKIELGTE